ncbi:hypothetical protein ACHWQZ_G009839 [Mnemiopsis leidyi]
MGWTDINIRLTGGGETFDTSYDMWREVFVWCLVSSLVIHFVSGLLAWYSLGGHPIAVYALPSFIIAGFFTPLFAGTITSAVIVFVYKSADFPMSSLDAFLWGVGQTIVYTLVAVSRIYVTL